MKRSVQEHIIDLWELTGSEPDLTPFSDFPVNTVFDLTLAGSRRLLNALNQAQQAIAFWRDGSSGRVWRWKDGFRDFALRATSLSGIVEVPATGDSASFSIDSVDFNADLAGRAVSFDAATWYPIVYSDMGVAPVVHYLGQNVVGIGGAACEVRANWVSLPGDDDIAEIIKVADPVGKSELTDAVDTDVQVTTVTDVGSPSSWTRRNGRLYFNTVLANDTFLRVFVVRAPVELVLATDTSELPPQYDSVLDLWALGWGHGLLQDEKRRLVYRNDFTGAMRQTQASADMQNLKNERSFTPRLQ